MTPRIIRLIRHLRFAAALGAVPAAALVLLTDTSHRSLSLASWLIQAGLLGCWLATTLLLHRVDHPTSTPAARPTGRPESGS